MTTKNKYLGGLILFLFAIAFAILKFPFRNSTWPQLIIFLLVLVILTIVCAFFFLKYKEIESIERTSERNGFLFELEEKYNIFLFIVDSVIDMDTKEFLSFLEKNEDDFYRIKVLKSNYLSILDQKISEYSLRPFCKKNSSDFLIASCLMYSLLEDLDVVVKDPYVKRVNFSNKLKIKIAFDCALEVICKSESFIQYISLEQVKSNPIYKDILNVLIDDFSSGTEYVLQFANLLHLLVLACQN